ncbi:flagellar hook assembly protein FlgD [Psychromonas sp. Urea-02u-13]|uniref:flagellar hook assembly protein FlgD n=1 Tax=Psychromonas sp. Urea-02u-13 TaxID=2058326 RepID=UPI000C3347E4|nr:flagellar hook assembly protein FlgD [Psychromonas sp. Urea-02u-13]PKG39529.1 flagellar basal body rod modification protein [Psychromonas sp. Urea-02u-13]
MALPLYTPSSTNVGALATQANDQNVVNNPNDSGSMKNEFLTLMVAQIQNQDPLNPTDGTEYVSQLALFSQVEGTENMVKLMQNNLVMMDNMQVLTTAGLVGQSVLVYGNEFNIDGKEGQSVAGKIELTAPSSQVNLIIEDAHGKKQTVSLGAQSAGSVNFDLDLENLDLAKGGYSISVELSNGQNYKPTVQMAGKIDSINIPATGGASQVSIRGLGTVPFYDISQFDEKTDS